MSAAASSPLLGVHISTAGGLLKAVERAHALGCTAFQLFTANARRWDFSPITEDISVAFRQLRQALGIPVVISHAAYLLNLASSYRELRRKSLTALEAESHRCHQLGIELLVFHPGSCPAEERHQGLRRIAEAVSTVARNSDKSLLFCVELTAGHGTTVGSSLEEIAIILERSSCPERLGVCVDTCHALAAGYRLDTPEGYAEFWERFDQLLGLGCLRLLHLNDSAYPPGHRRDRHAHIGLGHCGLPCFARLLRDPRWTGLPYILETPKGKDDSADKINLSVVRQLSSGKELPRTELLALWHRHGTL